MSSSEVDLLGEPRLKNGLTYYPGVQTENGSVILGNVVCLQLQAEGAQPYTGYGFLKGLWLWRDQPYIRVQYMAPTRTDLPKDAICHRAEPDASAVPELMVTNRVGDLHLSALIGPVFIEGGPLLGQLFQENVGATAEGFVISRHLDPLVQRVQPLDDAFRLTPIVQAFPKTVLRAILDRGGADAAGMRQPSCGASGASGGMQALPAPPTPAAPPPAQPDPRPAAVTPATQAATPAALAPQPQPAPSAPGQPPAAQVQTAEVQDAPTPCCTAAAAASSSSPLDVEVGYGGGADSVVTPEALFYERGDGLSPGIGPAGCRAAILLEATCRGVLFHRKLTLRCPPESHLLRQRLASVFGLFSQSLKLVYQSAPSEWVELQDTSELLAALERQPELKALPLHVSGEAVLPLPVFHLLSTLVSLGNLAASFAFVALSLWWATPQPPAPWIYFVVLPPLMLVYHAYAASAAFSEEFLINRSLRTALSSIDGTVVTLLLTSLLGPDALVLFSRTQLPPLGANISQMAEQQLVLWAAGAHLLLDVPMLTINLLLHQRVGLLWDPYALTMLGFSLASLSFNLLWHVLRLCRIRPEEDEADVAPAIGSPGSPGYAPSPLQRRKTQRQLDTAKYVGLRNKNVIGMGLYEA